MKKFDERAAADIAINPTILVYHILQETLQIYIKGNNITDEKLDP